MAIGKRKRNSRIRLLLAGICGAFVMACALCAEADTGASDPPSLVADPSAAPAVPPYSMTWAGVAVIIIVAVFLTAAVAGPLIQANLREVKDSQS